MSGHTTCCRSRQKPQAHRRTNTFLRASLVGRPSRSKGGSYLKQWGSRPAAKLERQRIKGATA